MRIPLILLALVVVVLQGCAAAVVTGAATGATVAYDRRTTGIMLEDQSIELKIASRIRNDSALSGQAHVNATSFNLTVLLTGQAPSPALRARAEAIAQEVEHVKRVVNEITVAAPSAMTARASDTLITSKVKTRLLRIKLPSFTPARVKVVTESGSVYLMGLVTRAEAQAAIEEARRVGGVQRVVNVFEYVD
ncbi:MAG: BON domain-containing protein [Gammaproteobacteria bacterium]|nr:BON domain-containing protein [Gammaproteobacteria bacterium]